MRIAIFRSSSETKTFAFTRGKLPREGVWEKTGDYEPSEFRAGLPTYAAVSEELSNGETDYVVCGTEFRIEKHSLLRAP